MLRVSSLPVNSQILNKFRCESLITTTSLLSTTTSLTTTTAAESPISILILTTQYSNPPVITDSSGKAEYAGEDFDFAFEDKTEVAESCSITYRGDHYVFGGTYEMKQISKITDCSLKRVGTLSFQFYFGGCAAVNEASVYLCFGNSNGLNQCHVGAEPLGSFSKVTESLFDHKYTRIAANEGNY